MVNCNQIKFNRNRNNSNNRCMCVQGNKNAQQRQLGEFSLFFFFSSLPYKYACEFYQLNVVKKWFTNISVISTANLFTSKLAFKSW